MSRNKKEHISRNTIEFDLYTVSRDVFKQWLGILFIAFAVFFLAYSVQAYQYHKTYTSTTTFTVNSKNYEYSIYNRMSTVQKTATSFKQIIDSSILKKKAAEELGMGSLPGNIQVTQVENTNLLTLSVTESDPELTFDVMNAILKAYPSVSEKIMGDVVLHVLEAPVVPEHPDVEFSPFKNMWRAFGAALIIMVVLLVITSMLRDTVRREWEVEEKLDMDHLGTLYHEKKYRTLLGRIRGKKNKSSILLTHPDISFRYVESIRKIAQRIINRMNRRDAKVLLVASVGENEGKSTVAANLALAMAEQGRKILLMDCDFRKPSQYKIFDIPENEFSEIGETLETGELQRDFLYHLEGQSLWLSLNAGTYPDSTELIAGERLERILRAIKQKMDYIILDSPPMSMVADAEELIDMADAAVLVVKQHESTVRNINDAIDVLNAQKQKVLGCIFNDVGGENSLSHGYAGYSGYSGYGYGGRGRRKQYGYGYYGGHYEVREDADEQVEAGEDAD